MVISLRAHDSDPIDPIDLIGSQSRSPTTGRPYVLTNMISSIDGAIAVDGLSGGLGSEADFKMFMALRSVADVIVAGAGTVRDEQYKPPAPGANARQQRLDRGQSERQALAVVTASGRLSPDLPLFSDPSYKPLIIAGSDADAEALAALDPVARIEQTAAASVEPHDALAILGEAGHSVVLLEGGPKLNGSFIEADCVDEWNLTMSPHLVGGTSGRASRGVSAVLHRFELSHVLEHEDYVFMQWRRIAPD